MKDSYEQRIKKTQEQLSRLRLRRREVLSAQQALELKQQRKDDLRRKLLAGAWILNQRPDLIAAVKAGLEKEGDRSLFEAPAA